MNLRRLNLIQRNSVSRFRLAGPCNRGWRIEEKLTPLTKREGNPT